MGTTAKADSGRRFFQRDFPAQKLLAGSARRLPKAAGAPPDELVRAKTEIQQLRARLRRTEKERDIFLNQAAAFFAGQLD